MFFFSYKFLYGIKNLCIWRLLCEQLFIFKDFLILLIFTMTDKISSW